jgi:hypothetical protein
MQAEQDLAPAASVNEPDRFALRRRAGLLTILRDRPESKEFMMSRLSLLRIGLACFAFAAGCLVDGNIGRIIQHGTLVQSAEAARRVVYRGPAGTYKRTVVRRPGGTYKRTVVRGPGGVYKRSVYRGGRVYPGVGARRIVRTGAYIGALPGGCVRVNRYGYVVWRCGGIYYQPYGGRYAVVRF